MVDVVQRDHAALGIDLADAVGWYQKSDGHVPMLCALDRELQRERLRVVPVEQIQSEHSAVQQQTQDSRSWNGRGNICA